VLRRACEGQLPTLLKNKQRPTPHVGPWDTAPTDIAQLTDAVQHLHAEEAVLHLDDLLLRRTDWGVVPADARALAPAVLTALGWDAARCKTETARLHVQLNTCPPPTQAPQ
ncbi:MAG: hypothetical protein V3V20_04385, partial [Algisphaera sp.]